jgi:hypothetical protein
LVSTSRKLIHALWLFWIGKKEGKKIRSEGSGLEANIRGGWKTVHVSLKGQSNEIKFKHLDKKEQL